MMNCDRQPSIACEPWPTGARTHPPSSGEERARYAQRARRLDRLVVVAKVMVMIMVKVMVMVAIVVMVMVMMMMVRVMVVGKVLRA